MPPFFDVRMRGFRDRAEVADVTALVDARAERLPAERVPLGRLAGRVLAAAVVSPVNVPGFARAAMDGYAVRAEDTFGADGYNPLPLAVVGEALPGRPFAGVVGPGQAVRVMTGGPVPAGADAVLRAEAADPDPATGRVRAREPVSPGRHVGRTGEDVTAGREVLPAGRRLRPQDVGLLAAIGVSSAEVVRRPRVAVLVTGDELLPPGSPPTGYRIVDSNSPMLAALVARDGGDCLPARHLPDRYDAVRDGIASAGADVILISGGSSVGQEDHAPRAVAELGELAVHGVALRPAAPTGVGVIGDRLAFLLPGNPVACLCGYDLFAGRAVRRLGGRSPDLPYRTAAVRLASKLVSAVGRVDYARVRLTPAGAEPVAVSGASILSTTVVADGFVLVDRDREGFAPGEEVTVHLYD
jgi:molybdopterin molybdotransferase